MGIYDVTVCIREGMPIYPGDPPFRRRVVSSMQEGAGVTLSELQMGAHTGTHVDAPAHMIPGGQTVDALPLDALVGPALVVRIDDRRAITAAELRQHRWDGVERVLFKTANSGKLAAGTEFVKDFVYLEGEAAEFLAGLSLRLVGVDYLSVDRFHSGGHPAHTALLEAGVVVVEGLDLSGVEPGWYELFVGPLKVAGGDGAPARVILRDLPQRRA